MGNAMTDTDRTNIYSYRGTDFTGDLMAFMVTIPCLVYGWAHFMVWMGGMR